MPTDATGRLAQLLREVADAHHNPFAATGGEDPDWPLWYATRMMPHLAGAEFLPAVPADSLPWLTVEQMAEADRHRHSGAPQSRTARAGPAVSCGSLAAARTLGANGPGPGHALRRGPSRESRTVTATDIGKRAAALALYLDGADEVDPLGRAIKGGGGAHTRDLRASASRCNPRRPG